MPHDVASRTGYDAVQQVFGSGNVDQTSIVVTLPVNLKENGNYSVAALDRVEQVSELAAGTPGVDHVYSLTRPYGDLINYQNLSSYNDLDKNIYQTYMDNHTGNDGRTTVVYVAFNGSPYSTDSMNSLNDLRAKLNTYQAGSGAGTKMMVGGSAAGMQEYMNLCTPKYPIVILIVFVGIYLILFLLLRCVFSPIRLFATMISVIALTLGVFTMIFQYWLNEPIFWVLPVSLFCILIGLGGDYVIFMMSRVREEVNKGKSTEDAILDAVETTGPVILLCGAVMATAFASMMSSSMAMLQEFGFVLSFGIIIDATIMIWLLIPAIMTIFPKFTWWIPGIGKTVKKLEREAVVPAEQGDGAGQKRA